MIVKEHPDFCLFMSAMQQAATRVFPWAGTIYRSAPPKWAISKEMVTGVGSMKSGARFNAPGTFAALYGSTTPELAMIESLAYQRRAGLPVEYALPLVFKAISVQVDRLLDLTDGTVVAHFCKNPDAFRMEAWWLARAAGEESLTQAIGRAAYLNRVQALMASSAHALDHGNNLIVFPGHLPENRIKILRHARSKDGL